MNIPATHHQPSPQASFQAGQLYPAPRRKPASSSLAFLPDGRRLEFIAPSPTEQALKQFSEGTLYMALIRRGAATALLHRFGSLPWRTAVCDGEGLGNQRQRVCQALARERSSPFQFTAGIIDPNTRTVLAVRPATLSPLFAALIGKAMKATDAKAKDPVAQAGDLDWLLTQHPEDLLSLASICERAVSVPAEAVRPRGNRLAGC